VRDPLAGIYVLHYVILMAQIKYWLLCLTRANGARRAQPFVGGLFRKRRVRQGWAHCRGIGGIGPQLLYSRAPFFAQFGNHKIKF
jgi:hypothetical protein